jgi:hypothetical protein
MAAIPAPSTGWLIGFTDIGMISEMTTNLPSQAMPFPAARRSFSVYSF